MSGFLGSSVPTPGSSQADMATRKVALMEQVKNEMALANAQALVNKINEKCYSKCVTKPSTSLSSWEQGCLSNCMDRYMEAFNIISKTYVTRMSKEREAAQMQNS